MRGAIPPLPNTSSWRVWLFLSTTTIITTPLNRVLFEKLEVAQQIKKFPAFMELKL
jgi:hypothetical protein